MLQSLEERFWNQVNKQTGPIPAHCPELGRCWPWTGNLRKGRDVRGTIKIGGKHYYAHRVAFFLTTGRWPYPQGLHKCDFTICCNPNHIFEGTQLNNIEDMVSKGRAAGVKRNTHSRKLTVKEIETIRQHLVSGKYTQKRIAEMYGVVQATISHINTGVTWE